MPVEAPAREPSGWSRRDLRRPAVGRQVRLPDVGEMRDLESAAVLDALSMYLPPGKTLDLALTDNRYSMIAVMRRREGYRLRLHRMFVGAAPRIMRAVARYLVHNDRRASALLGEYREEHQHVIRQIPRRPRKLTLRAAGRHHDLQTIFDDLNGRWFGGTLDARITWGPATRPGRGRRRRSIKMGSFAIEDRIIRIHPVLDEATVPSFFVAWIVFHEMLHGKHEVVRHDGRRRFHTPAFIAEERSYPDYDRSVAWEKANIDRLLRG